MKKSLIILAALAMLMPATSCKKNVNPGGEVAQKDIKLTETTNKAHQGKIGLSATSADQVVLRDGEKDMVVREINLTGTQKAITTLEEKDNAEKKSYKVSSYRIEKPVKALDGYTYIIEGIGEFTFVPQPDGSLKVVAKVGGTTIETTGTPVPNIPNADNSVVANLCRDWTVEEITINISGEGIPAGVSKTFTGEDAKDFKVIAQWVKEKGVAISDKMLESVDGYKVKCISFDPSGAFSVDFTGKDSFVGNFSNVNLDAQTFSYVFESYTENLILAARATGSFVFSQEGGSDYCGLTIKGAVKYNDNNTYEATVNFKLKSL